MPLILTGLSDSPVSVVGGAGTQAIPFAVVGSVTLLGAPWTTAQGSVFGWTYATSGGLTDVTPFTRTFVSTGSRTGPLGPGGRISLVTPILLDAGPFRTFPGMARLEIQFIPEPGTLPLLALGLVGLTLYGRCCRKR